MTPTPKTFISFEWIITFLIGLVGVLTGMVWANLNEKTDGLRADVDQLQTDKAIIKESLAAIVEQNKYIIVTLDEIKRKQ